MSAKICYLGDGPLTGAASYLSAVMQHHGLTFRPCRQRRVAAGVVRHRAIRALCGE